MSISFFIAHRFSRFRQGEPLFSLSYITSVLTISLAIVALLTLSTIMNAVHHHIALTISENFPYVEVNDEWTELSHFKEVESNNHINQLFLSISKKSKELQVAGYLPVNKNFEIDVIEGQSSNLLSGRNVLLSDHIAESLDLSIGDRVVLTTISNDQKPIQILVMISGLIKHSYQTQLIFPYDLSNQLHEAVSQKKTILVMNDLLESTTFVDKISTENPNMKVSAWFSYFPETAEAIQLEKVSLYTAFIIIMIISLFTIFSMVTSLGIQKKREVAILRMLGAQRKIIFKIFIIQGFKIVFISAFLGVIISYLIIQNIVFIFDIIANYMHVDLKVLLQVNDINELQISLKSLFVIIILGMSILISTIASCIPALTIAFSNTGDVLKYE